MTEHPLDHDPLSLLRAQGALTDLDAHFARFMERLAGGDSPELALG